MLNITNEYAPLKRVILGTGVGMKAAPTELVSATLRQTVRAGSYPAGAETEAELSAVESALRQAGVDVLRPEALPAAPLVSDQTCPRDLGFVIDQFFFVARSRFDSRNAELPGLARIITRLPAENVVETPPGHYLEGGDVVLAPGHLYLGLGQRSNRTAIDWLAATLAARGVQRKLVLVPHDVLHLDCCWNVLAPYLALWAPAATGQMRTLSGEASSPPCQCLPVSRAEQDTLTTNVLCVQPGHILARDHPACARVHAALRTDFGYRVTALRFDCVPSLGGSIRCATLPLQRS